MAHKLISCIFVCLLTFLLMSDNVSAFDYVSGVYFKKRLAGSGVYFADSNTPNTWRQGFSNYGGINTYESSRYFRISNANRDFSVALHDIVVVTGQFYASSYAGGTINTSGMMGIGSDPKNCSIISIDSDDVYMDNVLADELITYRKNFTITCSMTTSVSNYFDIDLHLYNGGQESVSAFGINFKSVNVFARDKTNNDLDNDLLDIYAWLQQNGGNGNDEQEQKTQEAADASEEAGESSGSDAEASSQSLLNATGSVISALAAAPATNCNIDMRTTGNSSVFTGAIGTVNLCSNVPSGILTFVQGLLALVLTPIVFYYCYHIVQYIINLFKEYQN